MKPPRKLIVQWGDGPRQEIERPRPPLTGLEFWEACQKYFPTELHTPAAAFLLKLSEKAQRADAKKAGRGRPSRGIGQRVHDMMTGPIGFDQATARRLVAADLCTCGDKPGFAAERCTCGEYARVTELHRQWLRARRKGSQKGK